MTLSYLSGESFCYLTTTGRVSGRAHEIEIWFGIEGNVLYLLSGGGRGSDWVKNLLVQPAVTVRIDQQRFAGRARLVEERDEDALVRRLLLAKYSPTYSGDLSEWGRTALPVAIDIKSGAPKVD